MRHRLGAGELGELVRDANLAGIRFEYRGGEEFCPLDAALVVLELIAKAGGIVLGIEAFRLTPVRTEPLMDYIMHLETGGTTNSARESVAFAAAFVSRIATEVGGADIALCIGVRWPD